MKREVNIRNSTKIVIQRNTVEVVGYNPAPGIVFIVKTLHKATFITRLG